MWTHWKDQVSGMERRVTDGRALGQLSIWFFQHSNLLSPSTSTHLWSCIYYLRRAKNDFRSMTEERGNPRAVPQCDDGFNSKFQCKMLQVVLDLQWWWYPIVSQLYWFHFITAQLAMWEIRSSCLTNINTNVVVHWCLAINWSLSAEL